MYFRYIYAEMNQMFIMFFNVVILHVVIQNLANGKLTNSVQPAASMVLLLFAVLSKAFRPNVLTCEEIIDAVSYFGYLGSRVA